MCLCPCLKKGSSGGTAGRRVCVCAAGGRVLTVPGSLSAPEVTKKRRHARSDTEARTEIKKRGE